MFFFLGFALSSWAPLIPFAKERTGLDDAGLGLLLLAFGLGSLTSMPIAGAVTARLGCRFAIVLSALATALVFPFLSFVASPFLLGAALFLFGFVIGLAEVGVNVQGIIVAKAAPKPLLSGFHGLFSVGGIAGAGGVSLLIQLGLDPVGAAAIVVALILLQVALAAPHLLPYGSDHPGEAGGRVRLFQLPRGFVLFIGGLCFIAFLVEGALLDWSALFLIDARGLEKGLAGLGYAAFALAMTVGRLTGDRVVASLGGRRILVFGGIVVMAGFALAVLVESPWAALAGFMAIGLGAANIVPVFYTAIGRQQTMHPGHAIAAVTALGYAGILIGPAFIGFIAHATSLSIAFALVGAAMIVVPLTARIVTRD